MFSRRFSKFGSAAVATLVVCLVASLAVADEGPTVDSPPPDLGYGEYEIPEDARFLPPQGMRGRADRRSELNPLADRGISWTTGYNPPRGTVTIANQLALGQRLGFAPTDKSQISASVFLPFSSQTYMSAGGQMILGEGDSWNLAVGLQGRYRRTNLLPGTADAGLGLHAVFDVIASDNTTWSAGVSTNIPVYRFVEDVDLSGCDNRREWAEGQCGEVSELRRFMPTSGYWVALHGSVNHFVRDWLILNVELFTGASQSNFFAIESALDPDLSYSRERDLVEDTSWSAGLGPFGLLTLGLGTTWRFGPVAAQTAMHFTNYGGGAQLLPYFALAANFGGSSR